MHFAFRNFFLSGFILAFIFPWEEPVMVNIGRQDLVRAGRDQDSEQNGGNFG